MVIFLLCNESNTVKETWLGLARAGINKSAYVLGEDD